MMTVTIFADVLLEKSWMTTETVLTHANVLATTREINIQMEPLSAKMAALIASVKMEM
jgi:hypothetical protein